MKKVLHISKYYYPFRGGTEQIAQDCVKALKGECEQKVICFNHEKGNKIDEVDGIEIIRCGCFAKVASQSLSFSYYNLLKDTFNRFNPDIVIFHYPNPFTAEILLKLIPSKCKLILYWHLDIIKQKILRKLFKKQNKKLLSRAEKVIATSPNYIYGSLWLKSFENKCVVVPNCINENRLKVTEESNNIAERIKEENKNKTICVAVGRHTEYKGIKYLIRASKLLDDTFQIYIIGKGELTDSLKEEARGDEKIHFLGTISDDELKGYYTAMDIYCFPSITKNEAFGLSLAEAMYYGKPAITFSIPGSGVNYVCLKDENGIEVENKNVEKYAEAMMYLSKNKELRMKYGKSGKTRVEEKFLFSSFKERIEDIIKSI